MALVVAGWLAWVEYKERDELGHGEATKYRTLAIVTWVVAFIYILFILCLCSQINLALKLIKASADFVTDRKLVLLVPIFFTAMLALFFLYWVYAFLFTYSNGEISY